MSGSGTYYVTTPIYITEPTCPISGIAYTATYV